MKWDEWRGSTDGRPSMYIKRLLNFAGWRVDLHKMVREDDVGCFHTHPANALRIILKGGYVEELGNGTMRPWKPLRIGFVSPSLEHRIAYLFSDEGSYSLWIRGPKIAKINVRGC